MDEMTSHPGSDLLELAADIVVAYVSNNSIPGTELPALIANIHTALTGLSGSKPIATAKTETLTPAQIKKSITPEALISFEDGKPYKTLRRHLTIRDLTPEAYRQKWGLPVDYPMTAAAYSAQRSELARNLGLGRPSRTAASEASADEQNSDEAAPAKRRGRPPGKTAALADAA